MKNANWLMTCLLAGLLVSAGCGKPAPPPPTTQGVTVDFPKLREAFASASADAQQAIAEAVEGVRYGDYPRSFNALAKLEAQPGLTEAQKKIVAEVVGQVKEVASKAPAAAPR